jgi:hypothetical protein
MHTTEPLVTEPSSLGVEIATEWLKRYKSPSIDQIPAELFQPGGNALSSEIYKLVNSIWNKREFPEQWKKYLIVHLYRRVVKMTALIIQGYHCYQLHTKFCPIFVSQC